MIRKQLNDLRKVMEQRGIQWYLVLTDDFHSSEYVGDYFKCRSYLTGFTGSAGTALVSADWAGLWTDGRYFLQAGEQLKDSGFELMKMGEPGVPTILGFLESKLKEGDVLGFDGRTVGTLMCKAIKAACEKAGASLCGSLDLVGEIWPDRPAISTAPAFELALPYTGMSRADKISLIRKKLQDEGADALVLTSLMDICWMMNIRGGDVDCTPVVLSYLILTADQCRLFLHEEVLSPDLRAALEADEVTIENYDDITKQVAALPADWHVHMDLRFVNSAIYNALPIGIQVLDEPNPTLLPKAAKNPVEVANFREAHIKDGVAVTRLMYWLKKNVGKLPMDELSVADKLETLRAEQEHYLGPSFEPIIAWGPHGAIVHYSATEETNIPVQPSSFLLADTGGHYLEGTTDITRTFAMGPLTDEEREMYTRVLQGHLRLGGAVFRYGSTGQTIDYLAHEPLWEIRMDYNHGTGHGVGYVLSVHEGPQGFHWRAARNGKDPVLEPGMITSDEPGYYLEGKFGVRLENLTVVCEDVTNEYGRFLHLEYLTMVPFDRDAIVVDMLTERDRALLNAYHALVAEKIGPRLTDPEEHAWLMEATRPV